MSDSLYDPPFPQSPVAARPVPDDLQTVFLMRLSEWQYMMLTATVAAARLHGYGLYIVGGGVRDLFIVPQNEVSVAFDLDFVVEGDAIVIATLVHEATTVSQADGKLTTHTAFGTANIRTDSGQHADFASARSETYAHPAALPTVSYPVSLHDDLRRRDFTINTLAFALYTPGNDPPPYSLIDRFGGLDDLRTGTIRVLHNTSFEDDPTRLYRAVRFAGRLGYRLDPHTLELMRAEIAAGGVARLTAERLQHELKAILRESFPNPDAALALAGKLGLLAAIDPRLKWDLMTDADFVDINIASAVGALPVTREQAFLSALVYRIGQKAAGDILQNRLRFAQDDARVAVEATQLYEVAYPILSENTAISKSLIATLLGDVSIKAVILFGMFMARHDESIESMAMTYVQNLANVRPALDGNDVIRLGVPRGPAVGRVLKRLRDWKLDNLSATRADEEAWVRHWLQEGDM